MAVGELASAVTALECPCRFIFEATRRKVLKTRVWCERRCNDPQVLIENSPLLTVVLAVPPLETEEDRHLFREKDV